MLRAQVHLRNASQPDLLRRAGDLLPEEGGSGPLGGYLQFRANSGTSTGAATGGNDGEPSCPARWLNSLFNGVGFYGPNDEHDVVSSRPRLVGLGAVQDEPLSDRCGATPSNLE